MNFEDEPYVRKYTRKTVTSRLLGWQGRAVLDAMLGEFDAAGIFAIRGDAAQCISAVTDIPIEIVRVALGLLIETETWVVTARVITWLNYEEAQNCRRSDRVRQRESRRARSAQSVTDVTIGHSPSQPVTARHDLSPSLPLLPPSAPSLPSTQESPDPERAPAIPEVPGFRIATGGVARTYSMPSELPPKTYLDTALMGGVSPVQAKSTWKHYWGAGLPLSGVERLYDWLTLRAVERSNQVARAPQSGPRQSPSDLDTTGAATAFRLTDGHREYAGAKGIDAELAAREYRQGSACARLDSLEQERDFLNRLKCWHATGTFHPDGPLPQPIKAPKEARA